MVSSSGLILRSFKAPADYNINHLLQPAAAFLAAASTRRWSCAR